MTEAAPAERPVMASDAPLLLTSMLALEVLHVPLVVLLLTVTVASTQTVEGPVIVDGDASTVKAMVARQLPTV